VIRGVAGGSFEGGGTILKVLQTTDPALAGNLRVLHTTGSYQPHPLAVHPRVPADVRARLRRAWLSLAEDEAGRRLLAGVAFAGLEAAEDKDYNDVRSLDFGKLIESVQ
jgi:phosphonate transport system substrate-binding protein